MIKKFLSVLISGMLLLSLVTPIAFAASNPYYYHDCTWFAWQYAHDTLGIVLPSWGYAEDWVYGAQRDGYPTGTTPAVNAVMVWNGHVGIVTQVSEDGQSVYICQGGQDDDYHPDWYGEGWYAANGPCSSGKAFLGYVYLGGQPGGSTGSSSTEESSESTEASESSGSGETPAQSQQPDQSGENAAAVPESSELSEVMQTKSDGQREKELAELRERKSELTAEIEETGKEIEALEIKLDAAKNDNEARLRTMYMFGTDSYLQILFSSENAADFFSKAVQIGNIIAMDKETVQGMENMSKEIKAKKSGLEDALAELNEIYI